MTEINPDVQIKPKFWHDPRAWFRRQFRVKLNDILGRYNLRVFDRVHMTNMRTSGEFRHILDVGVAFGTPDLHSRWPNARLELFEPSPQFYDGIETSILTRPGSRLHKVALGTEDGEAKFHLSGPASSSLLGTQDKPGRTFPTITVPVRRLDSILSASDIDRPCILKIDTEGYELAVLKGAAKLLPAVDCIVLEMHFGKPYAYAPQEIIDLLMANGFALTDLLDHEVRNNRVVCADVVFERR